MKQLTIGAVSFLFLSACSTFSNEEVGRLSINETSNKKLVVKDVKLDLKKGEKVFFWTEMDIEFENNLTLIYTVELWRDSMKLGGFQMNALETSPTLMETKVRFGNKTSWSFIGKMDYLRIEEDGTYDFKAALNSSDNQSLIINKAELIFKI